MAGLGALFVAAIGVNLAATRHGSGLTSDSLIYLNASRNLLAGRGVSRLSGVTGTKPITHYPPLFPVALAGLQAVGLTAADAARSLGAVAFGLNVTLVGLSVWKLTHREWAALLASLLVLSSPIMIDLHSWAMSEPLYLAFGLAAVLFLHAYSKSRRWALLLAGAAAAACAALTRYMGVSLVIAGALAIALDARAARAWKARELSAYVLVGALPLIGWLIRNVVVSGAATNRQIVWHPPPLTILKKPLALVWQWLFPMQFNNTALIAMAAAGLGVTLAAGVLMMRRGWRPRTGWIRTVPWLSAGGVLALYVAAYVALLAASLVLVDANTPVDQRIASPLSISVVVLVVAGLAAVMASAPTWAKATLGGLLVLLAGSYLVRSGSLLRELSREGRGYAGPALAPAGQVEIVRDLPRDLLIYTNSIGPLEYFYGRGSVSIPLPGDPVTGLAVGSYAQDLQRMRERIERGEAVMILFFATPGEGRIPLELAQGLTLLCDRDGVSLYVGDEYSGPLECGP